MSELLEESDIKEILHTAEALTKEWWGDEATYGDAMFVATFQEILRSMLTEARDFQEAEGEG